MNIPVLQRDLESIRAEIFMHIEEVQTEYAHKGWLPARLNLNKGVVRGLVEIYAWGLHYLYSFLDHIFQQAVPLQASEDWLDMHAAQVAQKRRLATKARGVARFYRVPIGDDGPARRMERNLLIPKNKIVRSQADGRGRIVRFVTLEDTVLPVGQEYVEVTVECEEYGVCGNLGSGQICQLVNPVEGIARVENSGDWLRAEGADVENDALLRERYMLAWLGLSGVTKHAYMQWALSVPGVMGVAVMDQHPRGQGTVDVIIQGASGLPTEALLARVRAAIVPHVPINDDWLVTSPRPVAVRIRACLELLGAEGTIVEEAKLRLHALFSAHSMETKAFAIGEDVTHERMVAAVMAVPGIKRILWEEPQALVVVPNDGLAFLESVSLTCAQAGEA